MNEINYGQNPNVFPQVKRVDHAMRASIFFMVLMLANLPAEILYYISLMFTPQKYKALTSILSAQIMLYVAAFIYILIFHYSLKRDFDVRKYKVSTFFLSLLVLITASPFATFLNLMSQLIMPNKTAGSILQITQTFNPFAAMLLIGALPGIVEELIYRGIVYHSFRTRSVLCGILVSAFSFGIMHNNFNQMFYAMYLGLIFALMVEATGSLLSSMILHALFNVVNTAYIYILPKLYEYLGKYNEMYANIDLSKELAKTPDKSQLFMAALVFLPIGLGGLVLTALLIKAIAKINGRDLSWKSITKVNDENVKPVNVFIIIGWIYCFAVCIFVAIKMFKR